MISGNTAVYRKNMLHFNNKGDKPANDVKRKTANAWFLTLNVICVGVAVINGWRYVWFWFILEKWKQ
jgi:hypothetical protein